jgi:hypothetical protein
MFSKGSRPEAEFGKKTKKGRGKKGEVGGL